MMLLMTGDMTSGLIDNILIGKDKTLEPEIISLTNSFSNRHAIEDKMIILPVFVDIILIPKPFQENNQKIAAEAKISGFLFY